MLREWIRRRAQRRLSRVIARPVLRASLHLDVEWRAAALHRWDEDLPVDRQAQLFTARLLDDTVTRIRRLFMTQPEIDTVRIRVLEPGPGRRALLDGAVAREQLRDCDGCRSAAMCLKLLGVHYRLRDDRLEPLT